MTTAEAPVLLDMLQDDDGVTWYPPHRGMTRNQARADHANTIGEPYISVTARVVWMRPATVDDADKFEWLCVDDGWIGAGLECAKDHPEAQQMWRCE